jgi:hypothetical protein
MQLDSAENSARVLHAVSLIARHLLVFPHRTYTAIAAIGMYVVHRGEFLAQFTLSACSLIQLLQDCSVGFSKSSTSERETWIKFENMFLADVLVYAGMEIILCPIFLLFISFANVICFTLGLLQLQSSEPSAHAAGKVSLALSQTIPYGLPQRVHLNVLGNKQDWVLSS